MPVGLAPDIVHVMGELPLSASYRPTAGELRTAGLPKPGSHAWYFDAKTGQFHRLTAAARKKLSGAP
jgi:putative long chain acyl-CoA synthase